MPPSRSNTRRRRRRKRRPIPRRRGAKLFVIFFLTIVPLLGMAILGVVIYRLLAR